MTVLVAFLPTPEGEAAYAAALGEAQRRNEPLVLLNSPRGGAAVSAEVAPEPVVQDLRGRAEASGVDLQVQQAPHAGELADEVLRVAQDVDASVVVIGLRKRTPVGKFFLGSNAQRILLDADRPVLAVKP
jgi:nucleotide-binding universal stress UspA family protein